LGVDIFTKLPLTYLLRLPYNKLACTYALL
jgi:hypothetical protein